MPETPCSMRVTKESQDVGTSSDAAGRYWRLGAPSNRGLYAAPTIKAKLERREVTPTVARYARFTKKQEPRLDAFE